jgi:aminomethyltransferase
MCEMAQRDLIWEALTTAGLVGADPSAFEYLRVAAGQPRFGAEITQDYIPLEADLWADVSFNKGCYTGQEIIARMESRGRLAKRLVALRAAAPLATGAGITAAGKIAGSITSAAIGPDGAVALGYVKTAALDQETPLLADGQVLEVRDQQSVEDLA